MTMKESKVDLEVELDAVGPMDLRSTKQLAGDVGCQENDNLTGIRISALVYFNFGFQIMLMTSLLVPMTRHFTVSTHGEEYFENNKGKLSQVLIGSWYFMNAVTAPIWGWVADHYGRRLVLLVALGGGALSMVLCAFSTSYATLLVARIISGAFDSTPFISKTIMGDICQNLSSKQSSANFSYLMFWFAGSLAISPYYASFTHAYFQPVPNMPGLVPFGSAALVLFASMVCCFFLFVETQQKSQKAKAGAGSESWLEKFLQWFRIICDPPVLISVGLYGVLVMMMLGSEMLVPMLVEQKWGQQGLGLDDSYVGTFFSIQGIFYAFSQRFLYPFATKRIDPVVGLRGGFALLCIIIPSGFIPALLPTQTLAIVLMPAIMCLRVFVVSIALTSAVLCIDHSSTPLTKGSVNGTGQSVASLARCIGSFIAGVLFDIGQSMNFIFLPYLLFGCGMIIGGLFSLLFKRPARLDIETTAPGNVLGDSTCDMSVSKSTLIL